MDVARVVEMVWRFGSHRRFEGHGDTWRLPRPWVKRMIDDLRHDSRFRQPLLALRYNSIGWKREEKEVCCANSPSVETVGSKGLRSFQRFIEAALHLPPCIVVRVRDVDPLDSLSAVSSGWSAELQHL
jgi:hypothetical protein